MISSKDNQLIKLCTQIKRKKYSKEKGICLVESSKIVSELYLKNMITNILVTEDKFNLFKNYSNIKIDVISRNVAEYLSEAVTTDGVFAICKIPNQNKHSFSKCLILDRIQDPSNLGAIIRSACAFGYNKILAVDTVYPYSFKSIRSSMGYIFDIDFLDCDYDEIDKYKNENNIQLISADMNGTIIDFIDKPTGNFAIIIGNEGQGIGIELRNKSDSYVCIPMDNNVESLNASVSASIIMYKLR